MMFIFILCYYCGYDNSYLDVLEKSFVVGYLTRAHDPFVLRRGVPRDN
jgi:hypothetical protein